MPAHQSHISLPMKCVYLDDEFGNPSSGHWDALRAKKRVLKVHATKLPDFVRYLGFGQKRLVQISADLEGRMQIKDLETKLASHSGPRAHLMILSRSQN